MPAPMEAFFRDQIQERQRRLNSAVARGLEEPQIRRLLEEVDAALERLDGGTFGICETCHDPIETDRLLIDPLLRNCIDHLTHAEQRALERDLDLAGRIQGALLPKGELSIGPWDAASRYLPAGPLSGDCCDLIPAAEGGGMFFLVGDVAGKGVAASLLMANLNATFRTLIATGLALDQTMERANTLFCNSVTSERYATLAFGRAGKGGEVALCNAGHPPTYHLRRDGVVPLKATGLPLGMFCSVSYRVHTMRLAPGESLFLYTDGLSEAKDPAKAEYGAQRLPALLERHRGARPKDLVGACLDDLRSFLGAAASRDDDLTLMVLRFGGEV